MVITGYQEIQKELISDLHFPQSDVLFEKEKIVARQSDLDRALALGNLEHSKIRIYFEDEDSLKMVETTVWGVTDNTVILKQGVVIPIGRIHSVQL
jgi:predicted phosphodiesterase